MGLQHKKKPCHAQLEGIVTTVRNPYIAGIIATMLQRGTSLDYYSPRGDLIGGCLCLCAGDLPPVAVEIAEEKKSVLAACSDLFEIFDFPSPTISHK
jgi:hypothetical protein